MTLLTRDRKPLAFQARDALWEMLQKERLMPGDQLPPEQELGKRFGVSRATIREALKLLEEQHIVVCRHGLGRFVAAGHGSILTHEITKLESTTEIAAALGFVLTTRVLAVQQREANSEEQARLDLAPDGQVVFIERVRLADGEPLIYCTDVIPRGLIVGEVDEEPFAGSLFCLIEEKCQTRLSYAQTAISAVMLDAEICQRIDVPCATPWVRLEEIVFSAQERRVLYTQEYYRDSKYQFRVLRHRR